MKKIFKVAIPVLVLAAGLGSCAALTAAKPEPEQKDTTPRPLALHVGKVRSESVILSVNTQGEVRAQTQIDIVPEVSGRIIAVSDSFVEGGSFTLETTLIKIDDANYKLAVTRAEARVAEAHVTLEQELADARIKQKQWKDWVKEGEPTPLALNKPQVARAQANLRAAEADLAEANLNLERTNIRLPFNGRVLERMIGLGQFVSTGTPLGRVFATDIVEIRLPLTDLQLAELNLPVGFVSGSGPAPKVTFRATLGNKEISWDGEIDRTLASIDQQTRLVHAIAQVRDPYSYTDKPPLAVGMFVSAEIEGIRSQNAMVMPRAALRDADKVFVIDAENKLRIRKVEVLSTSVENVYVASGVAEGEQVVTSTVRSAIEGMDVEPIAKANIALNASISTSR